MGFVELCKKSSRFGIVLFAGCTTFPNSLIEPYNFPDGINWDAPTESTATAAAKKGGFWTAQVGGIATDLALSRNGSAVLIATIPDPERDGSPKDYRLIRYQRTAGALSYKVQWTKIFKNKIRALDLSEDGKVSVINNYSDEIIAFSSTGKQIWKVRGSCRPKILSESRLFVCFHDDDADPDTAFTLFQLKDGAKVSEFPAPGDVLGLKTSPNQKWVAIALSGARAAATLTRQRVALYDVIKREAAWSREIEGEFLDFTVARSSGTDAPAVAVLTAAYGSMAKEGKTRKTQLRIWGRNGTTDQSLDFPAENIEFSAKAEGVYVYGNGPEGQSLAYLETFPEAKLSTPRWHRGIPTQADFGASLISTPDGVMSTFEEIEKGARKIRWIEVRTDGKILARKDLPIAEGAYLYVLGLSPDGLITWFLSDNGLIGAFRRSVGF